MNIRTTATCLGMVLMVGCAGTQIDPPPAPTTPPPIHRLSIPDESLESVFLMPSQVETTQSPAAMGDLTIHLGGVYAQRGSGHDQIHSLALVLVAMGDSADALLGQHQQILLEIDRELFRGVSVPPPADSTIFGVDQGTARAVVVPISCPVLQRLAKAQAVRGRLGLWYSFDLSDELRSRFLTLIDEVPNGARRQTTLKADLLAIT